MEAVDRAIALDNGAPRNHTVLGLCSWDVDDMWLSAIDRRELGKGGVGGWCFGAVACCCLLFVLSVGNRRETFTFVGIQSFPDNFSSNCHLNRTPTNYEFLSLP